MNARIDRPSCFGSLARSLGIINSRVRNLQISSASEKRSHPLSGSNMDVDTDTDRAFEEERRERGRYRTVLSTYFNTRVTLGCFWWTAILLYVFAIPRVM